MKIATRDFGEISIEEKDIMTFVQPIFGFEALTRYVILLDDTLDGEFLWLQSVENPDVCFVLASAAQLVPGYQPTCPQEVKKALGEGVYETRLVLVVADDFRCSTVNLKSPIYMNLTTKQALQTILEDSYPIRYPLFLQGEEEKVC